MILAQNNKTVFYVSTVVISYDYKYDGRFSGWIPG